MNDILLAQMVAEHYVTVRKHPSLDLYIYNYSPKAQYDRVWNEVTTQCRGLIMNEKHNILARPFKKFFNIEEAIGLGDSLPLEDFEVTEKMDGSLGILYWDKDLPYLATRGSFESEQAIKGTQILRTKYKDVEFKVGYTYLLEILYPENRIVIDYGGIEDIILLAVIDTVTGNEIDYNVMLDWALASGLQIVKRYDGIKDVNKLKELQRDNAEGFVIHYVGGKRFKVKFEEYVRLHRLITGVNARRIWDLLRNGQSMDELLDRVPDEFFKWVKDTKEGLELAYRICQMSAEATFAIVKDLPTRREQARYVLEHNKNVSSIVFKMLDKQPYEQIIWQMLKPKHETPFKMKIGNSVINYIWCFIKIYV